MANFRTNESPMDWQWDKEGGPSDPSSPFAPHNINRQIAHKAEGGPPRKRHFGEVAITPAKDRTFAFGAPTSKPVFFTPFQNPLDSASFQTPRDAIKSPSVNSEAEDTPSISGLDMDSVIMTPDATPTKPPVSAATPGTKSKKIQPWNSGDSYDSESDENPFTGMSNHPAPAPSSWADTHRDIPQILSQYLQLAVNIFIASLGIYIVYICLATIWRDVEKKTQEAIAEAQAVVDRCNSLWITNKCDPVYRVPHMDEQCAAWRTCADSDPYNTGRSKVSAETIAEILNGFVEPISYKSMAFCFVLVFGCMFISNFAFGFFRAKVGGHPAPVLAAAAPRYAEFGGASGVVHPFPAFYVTPSRRAAGRTRSRSPTKQDRTPFVTARKSGHEAGEDDENVDMSPTVNRKRLAW